MHFTCPQLRDGQMAGSPAEPSDERFYLHTRLLFVTAPEATWGSGRALRAAQVAGTPRLCGWDGRRQGDAQRGPCFCTEVQGDLPGGW